jgi:hypothetical protein
MDELLNGGGGNNVDLKSGWSTELVPGLDLQLAALIETVWECERVWRLEGRIEAVIRKERP